MDVDAARSLVEKSTRPEMHESTNKGRRQKKGSSVTGRSCLGPLRPAFFLMGASFRLDKEKLLIGAESRLGLGGK